MNVCAHVFDAYTLQYLYLYAYIYYHLINILEYNLRIQMFTLL